MNRSIVVAAILGLALHAAGPSESAAAEHSKRLGLAAFGGVQTYGMSDVNDAIITPGAFLPGVTGNADKIRGGMGLGAGLRLWPSERVMVAADVSRLLGKTEGSGAFYGIAYQGSVTVPATSVTVTVGYLRPWGPRMHIGFGAGVGFYDATGEVKAWNALGTYKSDLEGSGFGVHGLALADVALSRWIHAEAALGYRYAKTTDITVEGFVQHNADGSDARIDWSGLMTRVGITAYFTDR